MSRKRPSWMAHARAQLAASLRAAAAGFPREGADAAHVVHDARKQLKRSASLVRLLSPILGAPAFGALDVVNDARRSMGLARDLDVLPGALARIKCPDAARAALSEAIGLERQMARHAHADIDVAKHTADLAACAEDVEAWNLGDEATQGLTSSLRHTYRSAKRRGRLAWSTGDADDLHDLRARVVDLGLQLEVFEPAWPALISALTGELHRLRTALGNHNDLTVLGEFALSRRDLAADVAEKIVAAALEARKPLERRAQAQYLRIFTERPGAFERRMAAYLEHPQKRP